MSDINQYQAPQSRVDTAAVETFSKPKIFGVSGRVGRLRYLAYSFGISFLLLFVMGILSAIAIPAFGTQGEPIIAVIAGVFYLLIIIYSFMVTIQRCHDFNVTGWLSLILLVPLASLIFMFVPGTRGANNFGNPPAPNHVGIYLGALLVPVIWIGVLAAIAIPAYQGYVQKAQENQQQFEQQR